MAGGNGSIEEGVDNNVVCGDDYLNNLIELPTSS